MKPEVTLKEVLKPPFTRDRIGMIYDANNRFIDVPGINFNKDNPESWQGEAVAKTCGWGVFQYYENGEELQDAFMDFIVAALNEKWERDIGEPLQWRLRESYYSRDACYCECPNCGCDLLKTNKQTVWNYCPSCGVRLLLPREEK